MKKDTIIVRKKRETIVVPALPPLLEAQIEDGNAILESGTLFIGSEPGTGKTLTALFALMGAFDILEDEDKARRALIVCPNIAVRNWCRWALAMLNEYDHADVGVQRITKSSDEIHPDAGVVICTYGMFRRRGSELVKRVKFWKPKFLVYDESDNLNGHEGVGSQTLYDPSIIMEASWVVPMTGTPIKRYADDLWPMLNGVFPVDLKQELGIASRKQFLNEFCVVQNKTFGAMRYPKPTVVRSKNLDNLYAFLYGGDMPLGVKRYIEDMGLPERTDRIIDVEPVLLADDAKFIDEALDEGIEFDESGEIMATQKKSMVTAERLYGTAKAYMVAEYVSELLHQKRGSNMKKCGIFVPYWFHNVGEAIVDTLAELGWDAEAIHGGISHKERMLIQDEFNRGNIDVVVGQIQACGVAIDLYERCDHVVMAEWHWSHAMNEQTIARVYRFGQDEHCQIDWMKGTHQLEDIKMGVVERKAGEAEEMK